MKSNTIIKAAQALSIALFLSCIYPVYDGDEYAFEERHSVWQYLSVFSIYQDRLPNLSEMSDLTPGDMFRRIHDTLRGNYYTGYYFENSGGGGGGGGGYEPPDTVLRISENTVYFRFSEYSYETFSLLRRFTSYMTGYKNIVIDLRENGGGLLNVVDNMLGEFLPYRTPYINLTYRQYDDSEHIGQTVTETARTSNTSPSLERAEKVAVLVDGFSASASEIMVSALKDCAREKTSIVGERTYGKGIGQVRIPRSGRANLLITFMNIRGLTQRTGDYHRKGIDPDTIPEEYVNWAHEFLLLHTADSLPIDDSYIDVYNLFTADSTLYYALKTVEPTITEDLSRQSIHEFTEFIVEEQEKIKRRGARKRSQNNIGLYVVTEPDPLK